jgi:soluble lytic murein transglycosylase-like protein
MPALDITQTIVSTAQAMGVDPALAIEVALAESGGNQAAVSSAGAIGIFQLLPSTAADLGVNPFDAAQNIQGGVTYLGQLLGRYGDPATALAAYNWGMGNVDAAIARYGAAWFSHAPGSTQAYVSGILGNLNSQYTVSAPGSGAVVAASGGAVDSGFSLTGMLVIAGIALVALFMFQGSEA